MDMRVLVAPDKFKGTLTGAEVAAHVVAGLRSESPELDVACVPVADGGDGTVDAAIAAGFRRVSVRATGPTGRPVDAAIAVRDDVAVVELATAAGLVLLPEGRRDPCGATSYGVGELIRAALDEGCGQVVLGVGGSASTDGGAGMLAALGARLLDEAGNDLPSGGGALARLARADLTGLDPRLHDIHLTLASDVDNPLLGERGAAAVYGPQKGASPDDVRALDAALARLAELLDADAAGTPGAGAAGGVGYAALAVLGAERRPGVDVVLDLVGFGDALPGASLVVTGEGSLDAQTLHGKAPAGVAAAARDAGVACVAVCGQRDLDDDALTEAGIERAYALTDLEPDVERCLAEPGPILERIGARIAVDWLGAPDRPER